MLTPELLRREGMVIGDVIIIHLPARIASTTAFLSVKGDIDSLSDFRGDLDGVRRVSAHLLVDLFIHIIV